MKKVSIFLAALSLVLVTGCGSKKLTCTKTEDESGRKSEVKAVFEFDGDYAKKGTMTITAEMETEDEAKEVEEYYKSAEDTKVTRNGKKITMVQTEEVEEEDKKADDNKYSAIKDTFTKDGYTCK